MKEITVQLSNTADRPALAQAWLDTAMPMRRRIPLPRRLLLRPRFHASMQRAARLYVLNWVAPPELAQNKETLWWLNLLEIPPVVANQKNEGQNVLQLAIRSRFKFIYRPAGLGNRNAAPKLALSASGSSLSISNPTPFLSPSAVFPAMAVKP